MRKAFQLLAVLCLCSILFWPVSCGNRDKKQESATTDSPARPSKATVEAELQPVFKSAGLSRWKKRMQKAYPHFSTQHFNQHEKRSLPDLPARRFSEEKWRVFHRYFIPAPHQKRAIDLYSYGSLPPDSGQQAEEGSPDSEVNLVNLAEKTKTRLLFAGPGTVFQQAGWLNDSIIVVTGESDANAQNKMRPVFWKINIRSGTVTEYLYGDTTAVQ